MSEEKPKHRLLRWFEQVGYQPSEPFHDVVCEYGNMAMYLLDQLPPGAEQTIALRKLLESREAALRALDESTDPAVNPNA